MPAALAVSASSDTACPARAQECDELGERRLYSRASVAADQRYTMESVGGGRGHRAIKP
jgi:hypothetical protein